MIRRFEHFSLAVSEINRCWHKIASEELEQYGLKGPHVTYFLAMSRYEEGITAPRLCEICGKDKADVSRMMNILIDKGFAAKEGGFHNRYGGVFVLTEKGKEVAAHVCRQIALAVELAGCDLDEEEKRIFHKALDSIADHMRRLCREGLPVREEERKESK